MNLLILGGSGQVGFELQRSLALLGNVVAPSRQRLDLLDAGAVSACLEALHPALIVNAAAWTAVDAAESSPVEAYRLNAELPAQLAEYASKQGVALVHYSSDYVYPGDGSTPWVETSPTGPLSVYGASKLAGDAAVLGTDSDAVIFRTSWVYSARGKNFLNTMLRLGRERTQLNVVDDQIGAPTPARLIAEITLLAMKQRQERGFTGGLYHLAPRGVTSWYGFSQSIFSFARECGSPLAIEEAGLTPILTSEYPTPAERPLNSRLVLGKLEQELDMTLPEWGPQMRLTLSECLRAESLR